MKKHKIHSIYLLIIGIVCATALLSCASVNLSKSQTPYHLGAFPDAPKYSNQFYQTISVEDKELMSQREWRLHEWKRDAQRLEKLLKG
jgi:hypothetical protein